jgi:hypothetical protein
VIKKPRKNEKAKARYWAVEIQPQWVVTPGKETILGGVFISD